MQRLDKYDIIRIACDGDEYINIEQYNEETHELDTIRVPISYWSEVKRAADKEVSEFYGESE